MKIIHFIGSLDKNAGGTATYIQSLSLELIKYTDLVIITSKSENPLAIKGVRVYELDLNLWRWWVLKNQFSSILRDEKPDLVQINGIWDPQNYLFHQVCRDQRIKVVLSPHGMLEPYILQRNRIKKKIALILYQKKAINQANYLHATANSEAEQIKSLGFKVPIEVIPNGIDVTDIQFKDVKERQPKVFQILFLSRVHPKKGLEVLIESISRIRRRSLKVTIAGEGEIRYIEKLQSLIVEKGLQKEIKMVGGIYGDLKWKLYRQSDLFVLPTYSENFGLVVTEALASGTPVITTKGTPWRDLETWNCGWWIELNVNNLKNAIEEALIMPPVNLREMGENGKKLVQNEYDIQKISLKTMNLYKKVQNLSV